MAAKETPMTRQRRFVYGAGFAVVLSVLAAFLYQTAAAQSDAKDQRRKITIELTEDFYRALRNETGKTYTTERQDEHLRQIAVSTRFMVETNLRIIEQQARIVDLLEKQAIKN
jgi:hypothetical protein